MQSVTAYICTRGRYDTTLPLAIQAVITQTYKPTELVIYDDNVPAQDLRTQLPYANLFQLLDFHSIKWSVVFGNGRGQAQGHQHVNKNAKSDLCWRVDDDSIPAPDVLKTLVAFSNTSVKFGAAGGLILNPSMCPLKGPLASGKISQMRGWLSPQMFRHIAFEPYAVEHLHCSFIYVPGIVDYPAGEMPGLMREETIFSHKMHASGHGVWVVPSAVTYHLQQGTGGNRMQKDGQAFALDEEYFQAYLTKNGIVQDKYLLLVDMWGLGDAWILRRLLPEIAKKHDYSKVMVAAMHPEVWEDYPDVTVVAPDAATMVHGDLNRLSPYHMMAQHPDLTLEGAFRRIYGL
jgi:hypothetical protein